MKIGKFEIISSSFFCTVVILLIGCTCCSKANKKLGLKDDNFVEETIETVIEKKLGISIDLTPNSKE